jgi:hypothetical protein
MEVNINSQSQIVIIYRTNTLAYLTGMSARKKDRFITSDTEGEGLRRRPEGHRRQEACVHGVCRQHQSDNPLKRFFFVADADADAYPDADADVDADAKQVRPAACTINILW